MLFYFNFLMKEGKKTFLESMSKKLITVTGQKTFFSTEDYSTLGFLTDQATPTHLMV